MMFSNETNSSEHIAYEHIYNDVFNVRYSREPDPHQFSYTFTTTFLRVICVFVSRLGFILIQLGSIPIENVYKIIFYNFFEMANAIIAYSCIGYVVSFGKWTWEGFVGYSDTFFQFDLEDVVVGYCATLIGTSQISTFIIGRVHLIGSIMMTFLYSAAFQPVLMHWIWNSDGWMNKWRLLQTRVSVKDHGGSLVIHLSSSIIGVVGACFLGRRIIKVDELDEQSIGREHTGNTITGYLFIIFGYLAFTIPTPFYETRRVPDNYIGIVLVNNVIAFATGTLIVCILHLLILRRIFNYWIVLRCLQGGIAGIISISAGVDIYSPLMCIGVVAVTSLCFFVFSFIMRDTSVEDYCNMTASHLVTSFLGTLACPLIAQKENFSSEHRNVHILWQIVCLSVTVVSTLIFAISLFLIFKLARILRSKREKKNHRRALLLRNYLRKKSFIDRLFVIDSKTELIAPEAEHRKKNADEEHKEEAKAASTESEVGFEDLL